MKDLALLKREKAKKLFEHKLGTQNEIGKRVR